MKQATKEFFRLHEFSRTMGGVFFGMQKQLPVVKANPGLFREFLSSPSESPSELRKKNEKLLYPYHEILYWLVKNGIPISWVMKSSQYNNVVFDPLFSSTNLKYSNRLYHLSIITTVYNNYDD